MLATAQIIATCFWAAIRLCRRPAFVALNNSHMPRAGDFLVGPCNSFKAATIACLHVMTHRMGKARMMSMETGYSLLDSGCGAWAVTWRGYFMKCSAYQTDRRIA